MKKQMNLLSMVSIVLFFGFAFANEQNNSFKSQIDNAAKLIKSGQGMTAAQQLLEISKKTNDTSERARIKYLMGIALMDYGLNQAAAFQFVESIRTGDKNWTKPSIEKLLIVTDKLGDETLLNFAMQRVEISEIPDANKEMIYFRLAEIKQNNGGYKEAVELYKKVSTKSRYYYKALYKMGLAYSEMKNTEKAVESFKTLLESRQSAIATDTNKVLAQMAIARTYYQAYEWTKSIEAYSKIPKDHSLWHDALFEKTWALLRAGRLRSTLSNFHSLHSSYYDEFYFPETLLLRAIVYLYICQYEEVDKVISLYEKQYSPIIKKIDAALKSNKVDFYYKEIYNIFKNKENNSNIYSSSIPYSVMKHISEEGDIKRSYTYLKKIAAEKALIDNNNYFKESKIGQYAIRILINRMNSTKQMLANQVKDHLVEVKKELTDLEEQASFVKYEVINGKKEQLKSKLNSKNSTPTSSAVDKRSFFTENGYEFYPFQGEYWLDEIGNYHYSGKQSCE